MLWMPAFGGLLSGFLVFRFAPEAEGHGTDAMIDSFHRKKGIVRKQAPVIKTIASAITIGSGGSAGKEGPIAQIGSGFGSILASLFKLSDTERRIMLLAGAAGGIGAIFKAPLGVTYVKVFYGMRDHFFRPLAIRKWLKPVLGGLMPGMIAFFLPEVLGGGFNQLLMDSLQ